MDASKSHKTLNKFQTLFIVHVLLFFILVIEACYIQLTVTIQQIPIPIEFFLGLIFLPPLVVISWPAAKKAPSQHLRNYFFTFRWMGMVFWAFNLFLLSAMIWSQYQIAKILK